MRLECTPRSWTRICLSRIHINIVLSTAGVAADKIDARFWTSSAFITMSGCGTCRERFFGCRCSLSRPPYFLPRVHVGNPILSVDCIRAHVHTCRALHYLTCLSCNTTSPTARSHHRLSHHLLTVNICLQSPSLPPPPPPARQQIITLQTPCNPQCTPFSSNLTSTIYLLSSYL